jgi:tetratricopeptide (TPR) repeat protein
MEDPWSALKSCDEARAGFARARYDRQLMAIQTLKGLALWALGALSEAERELRSIVVSGEEIAPELGLQQFVLSSVLLDRSAVDEALLLASRLVPAMRAQRTPGYEMLGHLILAEVHCRRGDLDAAEREALAASELVGVGPLDQIAAKATLAAVLLAQGRTAEALAAAEDAKSRCNSIGARGLNYGSYVRLVHAECLHAADEHEAARAAIAAARDRLIAIAATIDDLDVRRSFLENAPRERVTKCRSDGHCQRARASASVRTPAAASAEQRCRAHVKSLPHEVRR